MSGPGNRIVTVGGIWANGAPDPPASPISDTTYANSELTQTLIEGGWPFSKIVDSANFNEMLQRVTTLLNLLEQWGVLPWCSLTTYNANALVMGSDGNIYVALLPSSATSPQDPTLVNSIYWAKFGGTNADWDADSGPTEILNKPDITQPVNADWLANSGLAQILHKPTIPASFAPTFMQVQDREPTGTITACPPGSWVQRVLNTIVNNSISGASLAANNINLPAGAYICFINAPAGGGSAFGDIVCPHQCRLFNASDGVILAYGTSEAPSYYNVSAQSWITGFMFTLSAAKALRIDTYLTGILGGNGNLGVPANVPGAYEIYTNALFVKLS